VPDLLQAVCQDCGTPRVRAGLLQPAMRPPLLLGDDEDE